MLEADAGRSEEPLPTLSWAEVREPGCYLHQATGLLTRIGPDEVAERELRFESDLEQTVVRLSEQPSAPLSHLRRIAEAHGLRVCF